MTDFKKQVRVLVSTVQKDGNEKTTINAEYDGTMYFKNGKYFVFYTEYSEEGEKMSESRIRFEKDTVEIKRTGSYSSILTFIEGKTIKSMYNTPYGGMPVSVKSKKVICAVDAEGGKILLDYTMNISDKDFENKVSISVKPL